MNKENLPEYINSMIRVLQLMKNAVEKDDYSEAYSYADGMVNDSEELRDILGELA